jgi:AcrR family transcriptional regulator
LTRKGPLDHGGSEEPSPGRPRVRLPLALSKLPPGRHNLPREFVVENQRTRLLTAALTAFGERGFQAVSVTSLIKEASTSRSTFYSLFPDKEACFLATYEMSIEWLASEALAAAAEADAWAVQVRVATARVLSLLAEDPRVARVCAVEVHLAGPAARARHEELVDQISQALRAGRREQASAKGLTGILEPALVGGANWLISRALAKGDGAALSELAPDLTELLLTGYLGPKEARRIARAGK